MPTQDEQLIAMQAKLDTMQGILETLTAASQGITTRANTAVSTAEQNLTTTQQLSDQITGQTTTFEGVLAGIDQRLTDTVAVQQAAELGLFRVLGETETSVIITVGDAAVLAEGTGQFPTVTIQTSS